MTQITFNTNSLRDVHMEEEGESNADKGRFG